MKVREYSLAVFSQHMDRGLINGEYSDIMERLFPELKDNEKEAVIKDVRKMIEMTRKRFLR